MTTKYFIQPLCKRNSLGKPQITIYEERPNGIKEIVCNVFAKTVPSAEERAIIIAKALNKGVPPMSYNKELESLQNEIKTLIKNNNDLKDKCEALELKTFHPVS